MAFSFGFAGDDIDTSNEFETKPATPTQTPAAGAFPVPGKPQLPPTQHDISSLLSRLPSKIAYGLLEVNLDDGTKVHLPRRELWDVRVQLMAEEDGGAGNVNGDGSGLGTHDVKTGVYEGGFKSWESSVDLVKTIASEKYFSNSNTISTRVIELGCGTALPTVSFFQLAMQIPSVKPFHFILADYNPTVLQLVTVPNLVLAWALHHKHTTPALQEAFTIEGELELIPGVIEAFQEFLQQNNINMTFLSGAWSQEFIDLLYISSSLESPLETIILGAETIYSPFALQTFTETIFSIFEREQTNDVVALVGAKKLYFGVGGSLDDFVEEARRRGATVTNLREEADGVRRGVVRCLANK